MNVLISFPVDQKFEIRHENDKKNENRPINTAVVPQKGFLLDTLYLNTI